MTSCSERNSTVDIYNQLLEKSRILIASTGGKRTLGIPALSLSFAGFVCIKDLRMNEAKFDKFDKGYVKTKYKVKKTNTKNVK